MRYALLISSDKSVPPPPQAEMATIVRAHGRFQEELRAAGKMVLGERLRPDSEASRVRLKAGQRQIMDGPFTETKEALGGFYLVECDSKEEAVAWAKKVPLGRGRLRRVPADLADVRGRHRAERAVTRPGGGRRRLLRAEELVSAEVKSRVE
jgi:hypothetical protein